MRALEKFRQSSSGLQNFKEHPFAVERNFEPARSTQLSRAGLAYSQTHKTERSLDTLLSTPAKCTYSAIPTSGVPGGAGFRVFNPSPRNSEDPPKNRDQLNPIVNTVKKLLNLGRQHTKMFGKKTVKL